MNKEQLTPEQKKLIKQAEELRKEVRLSGVFSKAFKLIGKEGK